MSKTHLISHKNGITKIKFLVRPSFEQVKLMINEIAKNHPYERRLWDMSEIKFDFTADEIKKIAAYGKLKFIKPNRLAIYVLDDLAFGEMRQFEVYREEEGKSLPGVFRNEHDAIEWLNS
jgi:hypothetical protein